MSKIVLGPCRLPCLANGVAGKRAARKFYHGTGVRGGARCRRGGFLFLALDTNGICHFRQFYAEIYRFDSSMVPANLAWFLLAHVERRVRILRGTPWVPSQVPNSCVPSQIHFNWAIIAEEPWQDGLKTCGSCPTVEAKYLRLGRGKKAAVVPGLVSSKAGHEDKDDL